MNIFYLHSHPYKAAMMHCDKHVVKMILETAQMLATAHRMSGDEAWADRMGLYKKAHVNHPSTLWVRQSSKHYMWAYELFKGLVDEYHQRYGKIHACEKFAPAFSVLPCHVDNNGFTPPPQCMPDEYKQTKTVDAYRSYYKGEKSHFAKWDRATKAPRWWQKAA